MQTHAAELAAGSSPLRVDFSDANSRAEWVVLRGGDAVGADASIRTARSGALLVGPATPWSAESVPELRVRVSVCPAAGRAPEPAGGAALLRVYYLPAGSPVHSRSPRGGPRPGGLKPADLTPEATGLGDGFSAAASVAVPVPVRCELGDISVRLAGAPGYAGTLLQLGLALEGGGGGLVMGVASIAPVA